MSEKRKQGRPTKFTEGKKSLALDLYLDQYDALELTCETISQDSDMIVSKGMVLRTALNYWLENNKPLVGELRRN